jgi:hypothetical protein
MKRTGLKSVHSETQTAFKLPVFLSIFSITSGPLSAHGRHWNSSVMPSGVASETPTLVQALILCCCQPLTAKFSIDLKQVFPLAEVAFEAHAFGHLKGGDEAALDLLYALSRTIAG